MAESRLPAATILSAARAAGAPTIATITSRRSLRTRILVRPRATRLWLRRVASTNVVVGDPFLILRMPSTLGRARHPGRITGAMADGVDDDLGFGDLVEDEIRVRRGRQASNDRIIRADADMGMNQEKVDDRLYARLNPLCALWRMGRNVVEDRGEVGTGRKGVAKLHRPCLTQTDRTCSSVANSPRAAAALETAIASRSSGVSARAADSSLPAS